MEVNHDKIELPNMYHAFTYVQCTNALIAQLTFQSIQSSLDELARNSLAPLGLT